MTTEIKKPPVDHSAGDLQELAADIMHNVRKAIFSVFHDLQANPELDKKTLEKMGAALLDLMRLPDSPDGDYAPAVQAILGGAPPEDTITIRRADLDRLLEQLKAKQDDDERNSARYSRIPGTEAALGARYCSGVAFGYYKSRQMIAPLFGIDLLAIPKEEGGAKP